MRGPPNNSVELTEASRLGPYQIVRQRRLAPAAHADRSARRNLSISSLFKNV
jgi:hypothetical protein